jgi:hypothetical protein
MIKLDLFQRSVDRGELGIELASEPIDDGDDGKGNSSGNQTIFDGGRAGLVSQECSKRFHEGYQCPRLLSLN